MDEQTILKMGVLGVGHMGTYHLNVLSTLKTHNIVGIYDLNQEYAAEIANKYNLLLFKTPEELIEKVEAVTIATPTKTHYELAKMALIHNCHVLVEKPMTETVEQAKELVELAEKYQRILQVGHVERFNGAVMELDKIVSKPICIETRRLAPYSNRITDTGVILDMLIHDLDIVINLIKSPIIEAHAIGHAMVNKEYEDIATIHLQFENHAIATLTASRLSQKKERTMTITQQQNLISLNYTTQDIEIYRQASSASLVAREKIRYSQESFVEKLYIHTKENPLKSEHIHFYQCITENLKPLVSNKKDIEVLNLALYLINNIKEQKHTYLY